MSKDLDINSMGITALRKEARRLNMAIEQAKKDALVDSEVLKALDALDEAKKAYRAAKGRAEDRLAGPFVEQLGSVNHRIREYQSGKKLPEPPVHIQDLLRRCRRGVDFGPKPFRVIWVSPTGRFFIVTNPGSKFWASQIQPSKYSPSNHYLMDCVGEQNVRGHHGYDVWGSIQVEGCKVEGRLLKATKSGWIQKALEMEKKEPDAWRKPE